MAQPKPQRNIATSTLQRLGLSEHEATLYTIMLAHQKSTVQQLGVWAPFPRTMLYYVLKQLGEKSLVTSKKDNWKTVYIAEDPEKLYDILHAKEKEFEIEKDKIKEIIPQLKHKYNLAGKRLSVRVFEGVEEYEKALNDCVQSKATELFSFEKFLDKKPGRETREGFERRRVLRKIKKNILFFEDSDSLNILAKTQYNDFTNYRGIQDKSLVPFDTDMTLYEDKILYTNYNDTHEPIAILIEDKNLYNMQKSIFDMLWSNAKNRTLYYTEVNKNK